MKIESIRHGRRDKEKLVIRTECGSYISARIDDAYTLRVGEEISCEKAAELEAAYSAEAVKKRAAKILSHHSISKNELSKKLREKGFSDEDSDKTAEWFSERGMIDDATFARQVAEYYKRRGCGELRIRQELSKRGIERELVEETLSQLGSSEGELCALIEKKLRGKAPDADEKRKLYAFLLRRGFKYEEIRSAMNELKLDTEDIE